MFKKPKIEKNGDSPINARINIKYINQSKPKISFSYPSKKNQKRGSLFFTIRTFCLIILMLGYSIYVLTGNSLDKDTYNKTDLQQYAECSARNFYQTLTNYSNIENNLCNYIWGEINKARVYNLGLALFMVFFIWWGLPALIYFPIKKKWDRLYPKWQGFITKKKLAIFKPSDVKIEDNKIFVELPVFSNVICDFKASKDFSKYLNEFDIREHKFVYLQKKFRKIGKKKKKFHKVNEWIWYARWYFDRRPETGTLEVIFK